MNINFFNVNDHLLRFRHGPPWEKIVIQSNRTLSYVERFAWQRGNMLFGRSAKDNCGPRKNKVYTTRPSGAITVSETLTWLSRGNWRRLIFTRVKHAFYMKHILFRVDTNPTMTIVIGKKRIADLFRSKLRLPALNKGSNDDTTGGQDVPVV